MHVNKTIILDSLIVIFTIFFAIMLNKWGVFNVIIESTTNYYLLSSFVAGVFFTSIFTTAPAIAMLATIGTVYDPLTVSVFAGLGALCGDLVIFRFMKNDVARDLDFVLSKVKNERFKHILHLKAFRWFLTSIGALIIASPLPDELGLALMGISKVRLSIFIPISIVFNMLGILSIILIARSI